MFTNFPKSAPRDPRRSRLVRSLLKPHGFDSSYHIWTNVSVRRGVIWGISVHGIHKGEVLFISSVYIEKGYLEYWSKGRCAKGGPRSWRKKLSIDVLVPSNNIYIHCCHMVTILNDYLVHSCWGLHLESRFSQIVGSWAFDKGPLEFCSLNCS